MKCSSGVSVKSLSLYSWGKITKNDLTGDEWVVRCVAFAKSLQLWFAKKGSQ